MSTTIIARYESLSIIKDGEVMVVTKDGQFRNSYRNVWRSRTLYGIGVHSDGKVVDITRPVSDLEMEWLYGDDVRTRALFRMN